MLTEELNYGLGWIESPPDDADYPIDDLYAVAGVDPLDTLPASYVAPDPYPPVLNQGSTPQCVAYSSATLKAYEDLRDQGPAPYNEGAFFTQIGGTVNGAIIRNAMASMLATGYPVVGSAARKIAAYYAVPVERTALCSAIATFGPLVIGTPWANSWFHPVNGVLPAFDVQVGGHAIAAIGWDDRGLHLRNSWGSGWGNGGDAILPWDQLGHVREAWKCVDVIEPKPVPPPRPPVAKTFVTVRRGQTLGGIAKAAHITLARLLAFPDNARYRRNPNLIHIGDRVRIK
jgi:hypothetical protein